MQKHVFNDTIISGANTPDVLNHKKKQKLTIIFEPRSNEVIKAFSD